MKQRDHHHRLRVSCCGGLTSVTIPPSVTGIGPDAFWECEELTLYATEGSYAAQADDKPVIVSF